MKKKGGKQMEGTEAADLMIREGIQLTEASIRLMAAGSKNLAAFLFALARNHKKLMGKTSMANLLREGKELKVFRIRAEDMDEFRRYAKQYGVLFAGVRDTKLDDGTIDLITNIDYVSQVNRMMERMGYVAPSRDAATTKKPSPALRKSTPRTSAGIPRRTGCKCRRIRLLKRRL